MKAIWPEEFEKTVRSHLPWLEGDEELAADQVLADKGLDSLATVNLLLDLEDTFSISFPDHLLDSGSFDTPAEIWSLVQQAMKISNTDP